MSACRNFTPPNMIIWFVFFFLLSFSFHQWAKQHKYLKIIRFFRLAFFAFDFSVAISASLWLRMCSILLVGRVHCRFRRVVWSRLCTFIESTDQKHFENSAASGFSSTGMSSLFRWQPKMFGQRKMNKGKWNVNAKRHRHRSKNRCRKLSWQRRGRNIELSDYTMCMLGALLRFIRAVLSTLRRENVFVKMKMSKLIVSFGKSTNCDWDQQLTDSFLARKCPCAVARRAKSEQRNRIMELQTHVARRLCRTQRCANIGPFSLTREEGFRTILYRFCCSQRPALDKLRN